jgi:phytoene synthase
MSSPDFIFATPADLAACTQLLRGGSRTFYAASLVLPQRVRQAATGLYAFCRLADDAIDLDEGRVDALARLRARLDCAYDGRPMPIAADRAFADVVARYAIPRSLPEALLEGFEWDAAGRRYEDLAALQAYAARVAGTVGAMMALLMGVRDSSVAARACDLGVAMQLTNIARDVGEDAQAGRLYLPQQWLREAGIDPDAWLTQPMFTPALGSVIERLLRAADALYERAAEGIAKLPLSCQPGMHAARLLYAEIGHELVRRGLDSVSRRAVVPVGRKARRLAGALAATALPRQINSAAPLPETHFLVEALAELSALAVMPGPVPWWNLYDRGLWLIDLFERLERRDEQLLQAAYISSQRRN